MIWIGWWILSAALALDENGGAPERAVTLQFTRTDGTLWECQSGQRSPETPVRLGSSAAIGSHTNAWQGALYTIEPEADALIRDGVTVGPLFWPAGGRVWDVQRHFGFAIDASGNGWLATLDSDADNLSFLLRVELATGEVELIDYIEGPNLFQINGLVAREHGGVLEPNPKRK